MENIDRFVPIEITLQMTCPHCGNKWTAEAVKDHGMTDVIDDDDNYCTKCGTEGEC